MTTSIMSFPDRGHWGKSSWRGNCSGHVYKALFEQFNPKFFIDPMMGSGTSIEVAQELGIEALGLDLHQGFNALRHSILEKAGKEADLVVSHPPYSGMVLYSGHVWGNQEHPDDLSHCKDDADFNEKMQLVLLNQREATKSGGIYGTIIGDLRKAGKYSSYQAACIAAMPADELAAVIIKAQHNTMSDAKSYGRMSMPRILHEYVLLWKKKARSPLMLLWDMAKEQQQRVSGTWRNIVKSTLMTMGGKANLSELYAEIAKNAPDKLASNPNWQAKVRQTLQLSENLFVNKERGVWVLA